MKNREELNEVHHIIGDNYVTHSLKSLEKRMINRLRKPSKRQPQVVKITTEDGKKYKLLLTYEGNKNLLRIKNSMDILDKLDYAPNIVWSTDRMLLLEFIEGIFPDITSDDFAFALGKNLADLHNRNANKVPIEEFVSKIREELDYLVSQKFIAVDIAEEIWNKYLSVKPEFVRTSMVYADLNKPSNYIFTPQKKLFFIDIGGFQNSRITDEFLLGSPLYLKMERETFKESYLKSGGTSYIFDFTEFITLTNLIRLGSFYIRSYNKLSLIMKTRKRWRRNYSKTLVKRLEEICLTL